MKPPQPGYRERIYRHYVSRGGSGAAPDARATARRGRYLRRVLAGWLPADRGAQVADLGCGSGDLLACLQGLGYRRLYGVDASREQVELARRHLPEVVHGDFLELLPDLAGRFDLVTSFDVVEHLDKDQVLAFLDGCHCALRPGGRLILQTPNAESPWGSDVRYGDFTHETCFNAHSLGWLLELCGFRDIAARETGPRPLGLKSLVRTLLWQAIRLGLGIWNLAETGTIGSGVYTRVFLITGVKDPSVRRRGDTGA